MKTILALIAFLVLAASAVALYFIVKQSDKDRAEYKSERQRVVANLTLSEEACKKAATAQLAPRRILDFPFESGFTGFNSTTTGFSYGIVADMGNRKYRIKCYMTNQYEIIKLTAGEAFR